MAKALIVVWHMIGTTFGLKWYFLQQRGWRALPNVLNRRICRRWKSISTSKYVYSCHAEEKSSLHDNFMIQSFLCMHLRPWWATNSRLVVSDTKEVNIFIFYIHKLNSSPSVCPGKHSTLFSLMWSFSQKRLSYFTYFSTHTRLHCMFDTSFVGKYLFARLNLRKCLPKIGGPCHFYMYLRK